MCCVFIGFVFGALGLSGSPSWSAQFFASCGVTRDTTTFARRKPCATRARFSGTTLLRTPRNTIPSSFSNGFSKREIATSNDRDAAAHCVTQASFPRFAILTSVSTGLAVTLFRTDSTPAIAAWVSLRRLAVTREEVARSARSTSSASIRNASASRWWETESNTPEQCPPKHRTLLQSNASSTASYQPPTPNSAQPTSRISTSTLR